METGDFKNLCNAPTSYLKYSGSFSDVRTSCSREVNFGVNLTNSLDIPKPITCLAQVKWSYEKTSCPELIGCPVLDPRNNLIENINCDVPLQSGWYNIPV